jgi:hypothetical protein
MASYAFVPFPDVGPMVRRVERPAARHDRRVSGAWFGSIEIALVCQQPVHVGSGFKAVEEGEVIRRTARSGGHLVIPGATLKGVLRARYEAMTRSCVLEPPSERSSIVSQSYPDVRRGRLTPEARQLPVFKRLCGERDQVCAACALFGYQADKASLRGRVAVTDLAADEARTTELVRMLVQYEPRLHHLGEFRIDRSGRDPEFEVGPLYGRKFYKDAAQPASGGPLEEVEAIPLGTRLRGSLRLFNLEAAEMGGLLAALGLEPGSFLKIGAGKGHGFGRAVVAQVTYRLRDARGRERSDDVSGWVDAWKASDDRWGRGVDRVVEIHGGGRGGGQEGGGRA